MRENEQTPDRRPLVYGIFAVAILLVAAFLFWPQGEQEPALVLTPESMREGVESSDDAGPGAEGDLSAYEETVGTGATRLSEDAGPVVETHIDDTPVQTTTKPVTTAPKAAAADPAPAVTKPVRTPSSTSSESSSLTQPGSTGEWVLNVGAFSSQANADRQVEELSRLGIGAHVRLATKEDGTSIYRVRVGYFPTSAAAKTYGEWLKRSQNLDSWSAKR